MADPTDSYHVSQDAVLQLARRPGMLLMIVILWPSAIVGALATWVVWLQHQLLTGQVCR